MDHAALAQANAALNTVHEIATLLDTGLDKDEVAILIALVENGVNPEVCDCYMACPSLVWAPHCPFSQCSLALPCTGAC